MTPPDSNGRRVGAINGWRQPENLNPFPTELLSPTGDSVAYLAYSSPLLSPEGATGVADVYEAERGLEGWRTMRRISPPGSAVQQIDLGGVSADHEYAFVNASGSVSPLSFPGGPAAYLAQPDGTFELIGEGILGNEPFARGRWISEGGGHVIFSTGGNGGFAQSAACRPVEGCTILQLEPKAPPTGTGAIYDRAADGLAQVVSLLPGDLTPTAGEDAYFKGVSRDGTTVAFTIEGTLYLRVPDEEDGRTLKVAEGEPTFAGLSDEGRYLFYVAAGNVYRFDTTSGAEEQINASGDALVSNVSADGSHVYFISKSQLGGAGTAGQPNLYVWSGSAPEFIATVAASDLERTSGNFELGVSALGKWTSIVLNPAIEEAGPAAEASRTTPDGSVYVFESRARLTSDDNAGHVEVYRYDNGKNSLICISCTAVGPASEDSRLQEPAFTGRSILIHNVTDDGSRVFFESGEALVGRDTGDTNDIYEWRDDGSLGGKVELISSGRSPEYPLPAGVDSSSIPFPNALLSVSRGGQDVLFLAQEALVPGGPEGGTPAIYDARADGGFPTVEQPPICLEEGCHPRFSGAPKSFPELASEGLRGKGNVKPRKHKRCGKKDRSKKQRRCPSHKRNRARTRIASIGQSGASEDSSTQAGPGAAPTHTSAEVRTYSANPEAVQSAAASPFDGFGIEAVGAEVSSTAAGAHPDFTTIISLNHTNSETTGRPESKSRTEEVGVSLPPGLLGNPMATPRCKTGELVAVGNCPIGSQVGVATIDSTVIRGTFPLFNLEPPHPAEEIARFGFDVLSFPVFIDIGIRSASDYGATATVHSSPGLVELLEAKTTIWGNPGDPGHDELRMTSVEALECDGTACNEPDGKRPSPIEPVAFMTNPSACQKQEVGFTAKSYQLPGQIFTATAPMAPTSACSGLPFAPNFSAEPTSRFAGAPTGLRTRLILPQSSDPDTKGTATMREARVTLPEGMTIAAGAADGLAACSDEQVGFHSEVDAACPNASKLGSATIVSPALPQPLEGALYQRTPTPGHLFGLWLVTDDLGLHVKLPGEIKPDPTTGQLTAVFSDLPQVPVEEISFNIWGGPRAPLKNPDSCGTYSTSYSFTPHSSDPAVSGESQMTIDQGCGGGGFDPKLHAGVTRPVAGAFSPFVLDVTREDGEQNLGVLEVTLPKGELAKLAGVPLCPDPQAAAGDCPAGSKIGSVIAAVGSGPVPLWLPQPGKAPTAVYLAGPYKGAPFSVVTAVPAQAGPFDLGLVTVRSALALNPETAQAIVRTDPLPQFIEGVAAIYRHVHVVIDRPEFSLNPTNCSELHTTSSISSTKGAIAHPTSRFQVDGCRALEFKPRLALKLKGGTDRGRYPALSATVRARKGDANIGRVSVALPHSEFLAQEHIVTICTRKDFAANTCPKGSIYGKAKAWTPLLDEPLEGLVYLRSSDHELPDLVMALRGQIEVDLVGRIDSVNGGIRTNFDAVPDAPVTKFVLKMKGGEKSLLVNSTDICHGKHRALMRMRAQNGRALGSQLLLESSSCQKKLSKNK